MLRSEQGRQTLNFEEVNDINREVIEFQFRGLYFPIGNP